MSWDSYIDNTVGYSKDSNGETHIDKVAICGLNGSKWTTDAKPNALKIRNEEVVQVASALSSKNYDTFCQNGAMIEGTKYKFLRQNDDQFLFKLKDHGSITIETTKTGFICAHCPEGKQQGICNKAVHDIATYVSGTGN